MVDVSKLKAFVDDKLDGAYIAIFAYDTRKHFGKRRKC